MQINDVDAVKQVLPMRTGTFAAASLSSLPVRPASPRNGRIPGRSATRSKPPAIRSAGNSASRKQSSLCFQWIRRSRLSQGSNLYRAPQSNTTNRKLFSHSWRI